MGDFLRIANELGIPWAIAIGLAIAYWRQGRDHTRFLQDTICEALGELVSAQTRIVTVMEERLPIGGGHRGSG